MERRQRQQQAAATTIITMDTRRRKAGGQQTPQLAVAVALSLIVCCSRLSGAFIHPALTHRPILPPQQHVPSRRAQPGAKNRGEGSHVAGKGFGNNAPEAEPAKAGSAERTVPVSGLFSWEKEYQAYIKRTGRYLCSMSWEGHEEMGRGAIFANYDDARAGGKLNDAEKFGGIPSMYIPLKEFESMRAADRPGEEADLAQIVQRVKTYRPETEFVVVFQAAGVMGTDIVRPNVPPPEMAKHVVTHDKFAAMETSVSADGVIDVTAIEDSS